MKKAIKIMCLLAVMTLYSCGNSQPEYSQTLIYFIFDNSTHQDPTLMTAMNSMSPGIFCLIKRGTNANSNYIYFTNNQSQNSRSALTALDLKRSIILGYNNGIIVGFGNLSDPMTFYAYDEQCPNDFNPSALPMRSYPLTMTSSGIAVCPVCGRQYDMNNGGNIIKGDPGKSLTRYRSATTGPLGVLAVN